MFTVTGTTEDYPPSLHDALAIFLPMLTGLSLGLRALAGNELASAQFNVEVFTLKLRDLKAQMKFAPSFQMPALEADRSAHAHLGSTLGREHHENQEYQEHADRDREEANTEERAGREMKIGRAAGRERV